MNNKTLQEMNDAYKDCHVRTAEYTIAGKKYTVKSHFVGEKSLDDMAMMRRTTVSYKNHKTIHKPEDDWIVVENNHEPIISQELWDKVREVEKSVSRGKRCSDGELRPLSGLMFCADCGHKMKSAGSSRRRKNSVMKMFD